MKRLMFALLIGAGCMASAQHADAQVGIVTWHQPAPVWVPAPVVMAPLPVTRVYRPSMVAYTPRVVTRYRPILGGSVTRVRPGYRRIVF